MEKLKSLDGFNDQDLELIKVFFYEGQYSNKIIKSFKWSCNQRISNINRLINKEQALLNLISQSKASHNLRRQVNSHVENIKKDLEKKKEEYFNHIRKQERQFEGQKELFKELQENSLIEIKATPLKQSKGEIYQKGVDVSLAIDLVHLAHNSAYDIAVILSGDTDLIEAVKLVKSLGKTPIIFSYHTPNNSRLSNISDLMNAGKFINLRDFTNYEIEKMSDLRKNKTSFRKDNSEKEMSTKEKTK
ncbi:NYN domain-containing protein [Candidatus Pacearchaeota archaeon]|nr:NYN domain-containing protein [Candidatus Pacearchaeota archaeon]